MNVGDLVQKVKGYGSEMNWTHKPKHYAAIHFHEDDIFDFEWDTDFTFKIPENMESGVYVMRLSCEGYEDAIPFFVCPPIKKTTANICILVSTFTYSVYGNHARPDYSPNWKEIKNEPGFSHLLEPMGRYFHGEIVCIEEVKCSKNTAKPAKN